MSYDLYLDSVFLFGGRTTLFLDQSILFGQMYDLSTGWNGNGTSNGTRCVNNCYANATGSVCMEDGSCACTDSYSGNDCSICVELGE